MRCKDTLHDIQKNGVCSICGKDVHKEYNDNLDKVIKQHETYIKWLKKMKK